MRLYLICAGTPTPTKTRFGTCYVLQVAGNYLMFDCGPAATWKLAQAGLLRAEGTAYSLAPELLGETRKKVEATSADLEAAILSYVQAHGRITRREVMELCQLSGPQAYRLLKKQVDAGRLRPVGRRTGRGAAYELNQNA